MINSTDLKNGVTFLTNGKPYKVIKYSHIKMGRGGAIVRVTARNLESGSVEEKSFSSNVKVDELTLQKRKLQFLYKDASCAVFMDPKSYEQVEVGEDIVREELPFIKEGGEVNLLFWDDKALTIDIPPKVVLRVDDTPPGVKGNSAANIYKQATLENGLLVKVPLFINNGERIVVDTRTGEYVERAK
ncbi:MAG: Elongation factor P [Candidatus Woesebacteria bacterium GW2011_GWB1_39_12]|uniref:Elongation factor P n=2 Tax=Candidatus Woeseibacteriota TaxID=1752722 RepID=A0A0G0Q9V9_9BACT|nr:MAG: Elongation factor P [Candidatus Woesebacteria bacterium GW2011_GWA1_39_12]KKR00694.1 MAG: Elongation factor P [Candidatus Woesebacteria bacterium GW2011_GWB1_39_12]